MPRFFVCLILGLLIAPIFNDAQILDKQNVSISAPSKSWHGQVAGLLNESCRSYHASMTAKVINDEHPWRLWPGLINERDIKIGGNIYGFREAMEIIWKNQHPTNCANAKYMISSGWQGGFGSEVHMYGAGLAIALELGRVFISYPPGPVHVGFNDNKWQTKNPFCGEQNKHTLECYYEPWSNCSPPGVTPRSDFSHKSMYRMHDTDFTVKGSHSRNATIPSAVREKVKSIQTIVFVHTGWADTDKYVPTQLRQILECSSADRALDLKWIRALTTAYILRPNLITLRKLRSFQATTPLVKPSDTCVAMYMRRGDKHVEMKFVKSEKYFEAIELVRARTLQLYQQYPDTRNFGFDLNLFVQSESPIAIKDTQTWGKRANWSVSHTTLFDRATVDANLPYDAARSKKRAGIYRHHPLEYLSMLLTIDYSLKCSAWVCTLASNFCRVIDELRATVGSKANLPFADMSTETCYHPPCIGENFNMDNFT